MINGNLFDDVPIPEIHIPAFEPADTPMPNPTIYPHRPGAQDTDTSKQAAGAIAPDAATLRGQALAFLREVPMTADECASRARVSILAMRPRLTELSTLGLIEDSGERRANSSGRKAIVWRIKG